MQYMYKYFIIIVFNPSVQHVYQLFPQEHVLSMCTCTLLSEDTNEGGGVGGGAEGRQVFVVGTALVKPEDKEPSFGRILIFQVDGGITAYFYNYM